MGGFLSPTALLFLVITCKRPPPHPWPPCPPNPPHPFPRPTNLPDPLVLDLALLIALAPPYYIPLLPPTNNLSPLPHPSTSTTTTVYWGCTFYTTHSKAIPNLLMIKYMFTLCVISCDNIIPTHLIWDIMKVVYANICT